MKIMIPILDFGKSGGYRVLSELANHWVKSGNEVTFLVHSSGGNPYFPIDANVIWINCGGKQVNPLENKINKNINRIILERIISLFWGLIRHGKNYDVIIANQAFTAFQTFFTIRNKTKFYYIQAYEPGFYIGKRSVKNTILKFTAWMTYFIPLKRVVNAEIYRRYKNIRSDYVVTPGLDLEIYYPKELKNKAMDEIIIGCIGRKEEWKGSEDVAEAIKILHKKGYSIKFKVAFNPVKYSQHELVFPDGDSNLADFYRSLDILVAPGHIQLGAIHYPVIEAMACNVPVITTGYYPANEQNSFIVPIKSPERIAETIELIMKDYSVAIKKADMAKQIIKQFDWQTVSNRFIEIFKETITHESIS